MQSNYSTIPHRLLGSDSIPGKNPGRLATQPPHLPGDVDVDVGASISACKGVIISVKNPIGRTFGIFGRVDTEFPSRVERVYWLGPETAGTRATCVGLNAAVVNANVVGSLLE